MILYNLLCESGFSRERESMWYPRQMCRDLFFETIYKYINRGIYFKELAHLWGLASPKKLGENDRLEPFDVKSPMLQSQVCRIGWQAGSSGRSWCCKSWVQSLQCRLEIEVGFLPQSLEVEFLFPWETGVFILWPIIGWMRPTYIIQGCLLKANQS